MNLEKDLICRAGPEFEVMCLAARAHVDNVHTARINTLVAGAFDWTVFMAAVERHYVGPMVHQSLVAAPADVPAKVLETLRVRSLLTAWKCQQFSTELARLNRCFESESIEVIHYKGAAAAEQYYGSANLRNFNDLDFLVRLRDLPALIEVLEREGYRNAVELGAGQFEHFVAEFKEFLFQRGEFALEPHWSIAGRRYPFDLDYEGFWQRAQLLPFKDTALRVLSAEDAVLVLCVVGAKGRWKRLQMVCDVAECVRTFDFMDWQTVVRGARATGTLRILHVGLRLAADLAGVRLPAAVAHAMERDAAAWRIARDVVDSMRFPVPYARFLPNTPSLFSPLLFRQRERWRDRLHYLWCTTTTPSVLHLDRLPLPGWLFPLYRLLVPLHDYVGVPVGRFLASIRGRPSATTP